MLNHNSQPIFMNTKYWQVGKVSLPMRRRSNHSEEWPPRPPSCLSSSRLARWASRSSSATSTSANRVARYTDAWKSRAAACRCRDTGARWDETTASCSGTKHHTIVTQWLHSKKQQSPQRCTHGIVFEMLVALHAMALEENHRCFVFACWRVEADVALGRSNVVVPRQL